MNIDKTDFGDYSVVIDEMGNRGVKANDNSFHMYFRRADGFTEKWGKTRDEDPTHCPWGNEIADIEITTACSGIRGLNPDGTFGERKPCAFCFPPDTLITMFDGTKKKIKDVKVGDKVLSFRKEEVFLYGSNYVPVENIVNEVYEREYDGYLATGRYTFWGEERELPLSTPEHPYIDVNWNVIQAEDIGGKNVFYVPDTKNIYTQEIKDVYYRPYRGKVYNFSCLSGHIYVADNFLVHNCYKSNTSNGTYMDFDTFKTIFDKMNQSKTMTQIAFGVDAECKTNPDVWKIMDYALENNVVPNVTVADIDQETAENIVKRCGAVAVSAYQRNKNCCYDSIKLLVDEAKKQGRKYFKVNMHLLVSHETEDFVFEVLNDRLADPRLEGMGAIVLLSLKQKGRGKAFRKMDDEVYKKVIFFLQDNGIAYGSDSCGANRLMQCLKDYYSKDNYVKQVAKHFLAPDGKYYVAKYNEEQFLDWSNCKSKEILPLYYSVYMHDLRGSDKYGSEYIDSTSDDVFYLGNSELAFINKYDKNKVSKFVVPGLKRNNKGEMQYCYYKHDIVQIREVPYEYLKQTFLQIAENEGGKMLERALGSISACESLMESVYVNVNGEVFPCSFMEGEENWKTGIDLKDNKYKNFTTQVWNHPRVLEWRSNAIRCINCKGCNQCPHYEI